MPAQSTFTLIPERCAAPNNAATRPMTSKQIKKAHKAANKQPKLSRAEQRKLELAEQERIRKELEKERTAARARAARERKKAKEEAKKEEKRRKGKPLIDVRPSQDTISRFVRGNGTGKKRDAGGLDVGRMKVVEEEQDETPAVAEVEADVEAEVETGLDCQKDCETRLGTKASHFVDEKRTNQNDHNEERVKSQGPDGNSAPRQSPRDAMRDDMFEELDDMLMESKRYGAPAADQQGQGQILDPPKPPSYVDEHDQTHEKAIQGISFDDLDDDLFIGLTTSFGRDEIQKDNSEKTVEFDLEAHPASPGDKENLSEDEIGDDALQALGAMFDQTSSAKPQVRPSPFSQHGQKHGTGREFSSFTEEDLDDELWQQLEAGAEPKPNASFLASGTHETAKNPGNSNSRHVQPSPCDKDFSADRELSWRPPREFAPLSTQAVLFNFDEYFPSPSQQEMELKSEFAPSAVQPSPCPPPKKISEVSRQISIEPAEPVASPKNRFFSASGSNEILSLALHRSRRTAALGSMREQERQRVEAGMLEVERPRRQTPLHTLPRNRSPNHASEMRPPSGVQAARDRGSVREPAPQPPTSKHGVNSIGSKPQSAQDQRRQASLKQPRPTFGQQQNIRPRPSDLTAKPPSPGKENKPPEAMAPLASQETEYGGDWVEEIAQHL